MPPHLHPRSRLTSSLFATTLFASFFVVALPHVLPCPAPRVAYADDGTPQNGKRRRRRKCSDAGEKENVAEESGDEVEGAGVRGNKRECPLPKPGGIVGEMLGFKSSSTVASNTGSRGMESSSSEGKGSRPP
jgi:cytochrome c oxidase assembly factor 2